jgi:hypothetical protein
MSSSDIDALTKRRMLLEDRAQLYAMEALKRNRTMLNDELRAASPDALYENKVLFSRVSMAQKEAQPSWSWGSSKEMSSTLMKKDTLALTDVLQSRKNLRGSHRNMIDGVDDLGLLHLIAEQTIEKGESKKRSKGDKNPDKVMGETRALIGSLRASEWRVIEKTGLSQDAIQKVGRLYVKFRGSDGLDKQALRHVLQRKQKSAFSLESFEDLWRTLLPMDKTAVSFPDLLIWASQYLPLESGDNDPNHEIEVSVEKRRAASRDRERQREAEEAAAPKQRVVHHVKTNLPAVRKDSPENSSPLSSRGLPSREKPAV